MARLIVFWHEKNSKSNDFLDLKGIRSVEVVGILSVEVGGIQSAEGLEVDEVLVDLAMFFNKFLSIFCDSVLD